MPSGVGARPAHQARCGSKERISILELAALVLKATSSESKLEYVPYGEVYGQGIEDMLHRIPAIDKVREAIGWQPTRNLDNILEDVIEHRQEDRLAMADSVASS